jgi:hypothetical protein
MTFEDRKKGEEAKFKHDQELYFKIRNRRNKLFGVWLAETHLGRSGDDSFAYAKDMVMAALERPGDDGVVLDKARHDLTTAGVELSDYLLNKHLSECEAVAKDQVMAE